MHCVQDSAGRGALLPAAARDGDGRVAREGSEEGGQAVLAVLQHEDHLQENVGLWEE